MVKLAGVSKTIAVSESSTKDESSKRAWITYDREKVYGSCKEDTEWLILCLYLSSPRLKKKERQQTSKSKTIFFGCKGFPVSWVWASFKVLKNALNAYLQSKTGSVTVSIMQVYLRGASKIKFKSMYKKRMATARRQIFFGVSQGVHCWSGYTVVFIITKLRRQWQWRQRR